MYISCPKDDEFVLEHMNFSRMLIIKLKRKILLAERNKYFSKEEERCFVIAVHKFSFHDTN